MSVPAILRVAPVVTSAELMEHEAVRHHEMFSVGALKPLPGREVCSIPILVDHEKESTPLGRVTALRTDDCWTGGTWHWVHAEITDPPGWLRKGTPVSISYVPYERRTPWGAEWQVIQKAFLKEVSLLSPGGKPAHPRAQVEWIGKPESPAAGRPSSDRAAAGEVIYGDGRTIVRRNVGQVTGVSMTDGSWLEFEH